MYGGGEAINEDQDERGEHMETDIGTDTDTGIETTVVVEAEQVCSYSRRRCHDRVKQDVSTFFPIFPYTYFVLDVPFTPYDPSVAWSTVAFLEPGLHSRVPLQYQSDAVLHAIPYLA